MARSSREPLKCSICANQKESPMDFTLSPELSALQSRVRAFIAEEIVPLERDPRCTPHGPTEELRAELVAKGRRAGLLSSHVSAEFGGLGLGHVAKAIFF
jgi:alkylation response protein AidB-like acyl-CoA dehydrogenase